MTADRDDTGAGVGSGHLGDDVARLARADLLRGHDELHRHRLAAFQNARELFGIDHRQRNGGDGRHARVPRLHAGVRRAAAVAADRADDNRERAHLRRKARPLTPRAAERAIARPVLRPRHAVVDEDDLAAHLRRIGDTECVNRIECDDLASQSLGRCRARIAECGQHQLLRKGRHDLAGLGPAHPHRHVERFDADVGEAKALQPCDRPVARARLGLGARQPLPDLGRQPLDDVIGERVGERRVTQLGSIRGGEGD